MIYTDYDFKKVVELANSRNIIVTGTSSLLVTLRLINQLWASQTQYDNVQNIIKVGENLYNNIATHAKNLENIEQIIDKASVSIKTEMNRIKLRNNGSIFKEAEKLKEYGISSKESKTGKRLSENNIPTEFLENHEQEIEQETANV
jgi:DNA recombination protein RmuC